MNSTLTRHPILNAEWIRTDGARQVASRVHCDVRRRVVAVDTCRECPFCVAADDTEVCCSPAPELLTITTPSAGAALNRGAVVVDGDVLIRDVVTLFVEKKQRMLVVADASGRARGVVHDSRLAREIQDAAHARPHPIRLGWDATSKAPASSFTSMPVTVVESAPLRDALERMATTHHRQLLVIDESGFPIGMLCDVDALDRLRANIEVDEQ